MTLDDMTSEDQYEILLALKRKTLVKNVMKYYLERIAESINTSANDDQLKKLQQKYKKLQDEYWVILKAELG